MIRARISAGVHQGRLASTVKYKSKNTLARDTRIRATEGCRSLQKSALSVPIINDSSFVGERCGMGRGREPGGIGFRPEQPMPTIREQPMPTKTGAGYMLFLYYETCTVRKYYYSTLWRESRFQYQVSRPQDRFPSGKYDRGKFRAGHVLWLLPALTNFFPARTYSTKSR